MSTKLPAEAVMAVYRWSSGQAWEGQPSTAVAAGERHGSHLLTLLAADQD
jgi:hypothetical protein